MRPHIPGCVFVRLDLGRDPWRAVDSTIRLSRLVNNGDVPAPVPEGVVEALQDMGLDNGRIVITSSLRPGGKVAILNGWIARDASWFC